MCVFQTVNYIQARKFRAKALAYIFSSTKSLFQIAEHTEITCISTFFLPCKKKSVYLEVKRFEVRVQFVPCVQKIIII